MTDKEIEQMWKDFENVVFDEDEDGEFILSKNWSSVKLDTSDLPNANRSYSSKDIIAYAEGVFSDKIMHLSPVLLIRSKTFCICLVI